MSDGDSVYKPENFHKNVVTPVKTCLECTRTPVKTCVAVCCNVLQCAAVCCSVLQCVAMCCNVLQCVARLVRNFYGSPSTFIFTGVTKFS